MPASGICKLEFWNLESRKALMSQIEHFAIYADDPTALKDFYVGVFGLHVIFESGGDPPAYFLADDHGMAIEVLGRPAGNAGVNQRWVCHLALWIKTFPASGPSSNAWGSSSRARRSWITTTSRRRFSPILAATGRRSSGGKNDWAKADDGGMHGLAARRPLPLTDDRQLGLARLCHDRCRVVDRRRRRRRRWVDRRQCERLVSGACGDNRGTLPSGDSLRRWRRPVPLPGSCRATR